MPQVPSSLVRGVQENEITLRAKRTQLIPSEKCAADDALFNLVNEMSFSARISKLIVHLCFMKQETCGMCEIHTIARDI